MFSLKKRFSLKRFVFGDLKMCLRLNERTKVQTKNTCMSVKRNVLKLGTVFTLQYRPR